MAKVIVQVENADYYDTVQIFIDGVPYGKKQGNSTFEIPAFVGKHIIHGIYDNMEPDFEGISHALIPIEFEIASEDVHFTVKISNICSGGRLIKG